MADLNKKTTLGAYMILKNEEDCILSCLNSILPFCDEIVIVDTGCTDKTIDIIESLHSNKIKIYYFKWIDDFSAARNYAMSLSTTDYCFTTDADETFNEPLIEEILNFKENDFYDADGIELLLLNYNENNSSYYLGGRTIVKRINYPMPVWKYKIHEKLYFKEEKMYYIRDGEKYILHKKHSNNATSNYNKYAEIYYNDLNSNNNFTENKLAHYFYYLYYTLYNSDLFTAKRFLKYCYDDKKIKADSEEQRTSLVKDGHLTKEEYETFLLLNTGNLNENCIKQFYNYLTEENARFFLLDYAYKNTQITKESEFIYPSLSVLYYNYGMINDFIDVTSRHIFEHPDSNIAKYNMNFINNFILPVREKYCILFDCQKDFAIPSLMFYFSHYFEECYFINTKDDFEKKYNIPFKKYNFTKPETPNKNIIQINCDKFLSPQKIDQFFKSTLLDKNNNLPNYFVFG